jgi:hypothetical protein
MIEITLDLVCALDDDELRTRGAQLSSTSLEYDLVEDQKKTATKEFGDQLKALRGEMRRLSGNIRRKAETRPVQCIVEFHSPVVGTKRISRIDTGEFVRDEPMTAEEHQNNLFEDKTVPKKERPN